MKNLIFASAILLGGITAATAQSKPENTAMNSPQESTVKVQTETTMDSADEATISVAVQDYKEVKSSDVPQAVKDAVTKTFEATTISKAYVNEKGEYKLELSNADAKSSTVYSTDKGEWIKKGKVDEIKKQ